MIGRHNMIVWIINITIILCVLDHINMLYADMGWILCDFFFAKLIAKRELVSIICKSFWNNSILLSIKKM